MEFYQITGGKRLMGDVLIHGAKNSVLPILAATVLSGGQCTIHNCPNLSDVDTSEAILRHLGCRAQRQGNDFAVDASTVTRCDIPMELMRDMRSSVLYLGALVARCGEADLVTPGGCALGARPIDMHLAALEQMGVTARMEGDRILCRAERLRACSHSFPFPSVGATENAMLAAVGCGGEVPLSNTAREPEVGDLIRFLRAMGAEAAAENGRILIRGGAKLHGAEFTVMPDRIEAATYLAAAAACGGDLLLRGAEREALGSVIGCLSASGCGIADDGAGLRIRRTDALRAPDRIRTAPYPGFPTDAQAPVTAALLRAEGITEVTETIFENRMRHVPELQRMGAEITLCGRTARICGTAHLHGAEVWAADLRCGAALVIAALSADGGSRVYGVKYIHRGYDGLETNLRRAGAEIALTDEQPA